MVMTHFRGERLAGGARAWRRPRSAVSTAAAGRDYRAPTAVARISMSSSPDFDIDRRDSHDRRNGLVADEVLDVEPQACAGVVQHHDLGIADGQDIVLVQLAGFAQAADRRTGRRGAGRGSSLSSRRPAARS